MTASAALPRTAAARGLTDRFPGLAGYARAGLLTGVPTPVERSAVAPELWIKRDDLTAAAIGGNKVRALDFLLGGVAPGMHVVTVGASGSTHALTTAVHARRLGATVTVIRWPQELNPVAQEVARRIERDANHVYRSRSVVGAYWRALRMRTAADVRWVPAGATSPVGILGHVEGALELSAQIDAGLCPVPARIVVPLGTGGTAVGLAVGMAIAGHPTRIIAVRVVSRVVANRVRMALLTRRVRRLLEQSTAGASTPPIGPDRLQLVEGYFGGAYGRETAMGRQAAADFLRVHGPTGLEPSYTAKAFAAALARCDSAPTLFWLTFDSRWIDRNPSSTAFEPRIST